MNDNKIKTTKDSTGTTKLLFDSNIAKECCDYAVTHKIDIISIYPGIYTAKDLEPIIPISKYVKGLLLEDYVQYNNLNLFENLTILSVPDNGKDTVDLNNFPYLERLSCKFSQRIRGLEFCNNLTSLSIGNFKSKTNNLSTLPLINKLEQLSLFQTNISSLEGIERFNNLKQFELYSASKMESIASLKEISHCLLEIEIEKCKNIHDYEVLGKLKNLTKIKLIESGEIKTLAFLKNLPQLNYLFFWGTNVLDGNLKYCEGINYVSFDNKRHYSHKSEQFKKS
ncbi:MAG: hypothetical protein H6Q25_1550 [Bacteroidetes bacterium]|nr:hypothetical protein [Bacteroidota bacterium]